jgi:hypothetical protein
MDTDVNVRSIRLMPSPGPHIDDPVYRGPWKVLTDKDEYRFTFQATLWRTNDYVKFLDIVRNGSARDFNDTGLPYNKWSKYCIDVNVAENRKGQDIFKTFSMVKDMRHLSIEREHQDSNAVFLAPFPYRPTAVVRGVLQPWAKEFLEREGFDNVLF